MTATSVSLVRETIHELHARAAARHAAVAPFDPSSSPLHERAIFVVGAPRSGTTWLHQLLAVHPDVATGGEAHVFCEGVAALFENHDDPDAHMKLSTWVARPELQRLVRQLVDGIFTTLRDAVRPDARFVLDKTPNHVPYARTLAEVYPDAAFVHIVRDARDSVSSQHDLWGSWDAQSRAWGAAGRAWRASVEDAREHLSHLRYHEVRYEDLVASPEAGLARILDLIGLDHDDAYVAEAVAFGRAPINVRASDPRVGVRKWKDMDPLAEREVVRAAGDLLVELGYLTPAERSSILARRTWRDALDAGRSLAGRGAAEVRRRRARAAESASAARRAAVREVVRGVVDDAVAGRAAPAELADLRGGRVVELSADEKAGSADVVTADGRRLLVRCFVGDGRVERIVVQR